MSRPLYVALKVVALCTYPSLLDSPDFPDDVKLRAERILQGIKGSSIGINNNNNYYYYFYYYRIIVHHHRRRQRLSLFSMTFSIDVQYELCIGKLYDCGKVPRNFMELHNVVVELCVFQDEILLLRYKPITIPTRQYIG